MKKGDVVSGKLIPAHQNAPEAVHPAVGAFHHPAPGFEASLLFDGLALLTPAADVGGEAEFLQGCWRRMELTFSNRVIRSESQACALCDANAPPTADYAYSPTQRDF